MKKNNSSPSPEGFKKAVESVPTLTHQGYNPLWKYRMEGLGGDEANERIKRDREYLLSLYDLFLVSCKWLSLFEKTKNPTMNSYGIKHVIERLEGNGCYMPNGVVITAAIFLGLNYKPGAESDLNVLLPISKKCPFIIKAGK